MADNKGSVHIKINRVAKLIALTRSRGFNTGREVNGVMTSGDAFAETAEKTSECLVSEEVETLFRLLQTERLEVKDRKSP